MHCSRVCLSSAVNQYLTHRLCVAVQRCWDLLQLPHRRPQLQQLWQEGETATEAAAESRRWAHTASALHT